LHWLLLDREVRILRIERRRTSVLYGIGGDRSGCRHVEPS
jgi:hypothetical protein